MQVTVHMQDIRGMILSIQTDAKTGYISHISDLKSRCLRVNGCWVAEDDYDIVVQLIWAQICEENLLN